MEKKVIVAKEEAEKKNVVLIFDRSNSLTWTKEGYTTYINTVKKFADKVNEKANITQCIIFGNGAKSISYETLKSSDSHWAAGRWGTIYEDALNKINNSNTIDCIVFFSDGAPTYDLGIVGMGEVPYSDEKKDQAPWKGILKKVNALKNAGVTIYTVGLKRSSDKFSAGLKVMASTDLNNNPLYYQSEGISTLFDEVFNIMFADMALPDSYTSTNGIININYVDRISKIKIGSKTYTGEELSTFIDTYIKDQQIITDGSITYTSGRLYLKDIIGLNGNENITITFK